MHIERINPEVHVSGLTYLFIYVYIIFKTSFKKKK